MYKVARAPRVSCVYHLFRGLLPALTILTVVFVGKSLVRVIEESVVGRDEEEREMRAGEWREDRRVLNGVMRRSYEDNGHGSFQVAVALARPFSISTVGESMGLGAGGGSSWCCCPASS